ncbi:hypothetical protein [Desulfosporosinus sp. BICA1-9]|uniref:hypothetical protein n=1 Tax=Desulfosporosinus sp. BICA1-9 TaxID=1531958 RepID=UPI000AB2D500|nr:hypothetical protein [Desulfosporosinus sp. BICA1-9]
MNNSLKPGLFFEFQFKVPENKTVPYFILNPPNPSDAFVLATGFMVGLMQTPG